MGKLPVQPQDKYVLRLPDGMRDRLKASAEENNRSLNSEIIARLEASESTENARDEQLERYRSAIRSQQNLIENERKRHEQSLTEQINKDLLSQLNERKLEIGHLRRVNALVAFIVRDATTNLEDGKLLRLARLLEEAKIIEGVPMARDEMRRNALELLDLMDEDDVIQSR